MTLLKNSKVAILALPCKAGLRGKRDVKGEAAKAESARHSQQARPVWYSQALRLDSKACTAPSLLSCTCRTASHHHTFLVLTLSPCFFRLPCGMQKVIRMVA